MISLILLTMLSAEAKPFMTGAEIKAEARSREKAKPKQMFVPYLPLEDLISESEQDRIDAKKLKKQKEPKVAPSGVPVGFCTQERGFWATLLFPAAHAMASCRRAVEPDPVPSGTPTPLPSAAPSVGPIPSPSAVPLVGVDLRSCDTPVKTQAGPLCTAWGSASAIENLRCKGGDISEKHIWSWYKQYSSQAAVNATTQPGRWVTLESFWPGANNNPYTGYLDPKNTRVRAVAWTYLDDDIDKVKKALDYKHPVKIAHSVSSDEANCRATIRWDPSVNSDTGGGHDVTVVGYGLDPDFKDGGYLILKNSWSTTCHDQGYAYMSFGYCGRAGSYCQFWSLDSIEER